MLKLFFSPGTCARASHIALLEAGADFELDLIDFSQTQQQSAAFLQVNPKGRVPALQTDRGILTETPAILAYIAQCYPKARLAALDDPFEFARMQSFNSYLCATVHVAHAMSRRGERWADDEAAIAEMKRKAPSSVAACFQLIEDQLFRGPWVMGVQYTVADAYLFTITQWLPAHKIDSSIYPQIHAHLQRMLERNSVQLAILAESQDHPAR